jgi:prepilin-type N-terminal cleavage/methylation domain-containing protein
MGGPAVSARRRPIAPARRGSAGMTMVELLMSLVILAIGVLSVSALFPLGSRTSTDGRLLTQGTDLAQQKMEQLRTQAYSAADLTAGTHPSGGSETVGTNGRFTRWWTVTQGTGSFSDVKLVDIRVTWTAPRPDTVRLVTYFKR